MAKTIMLIDDTPEILEVKVRLLKAAGFEVQGYQYPNEALAQLANQIHPRALVTDTEMQPFSGPALVTYLSPRTNRSDNLILEGSIETADVRHYKDIQAFRKILEMQGRYHGQVILTSRQELTEQAIDQNLSLQGRIQLAVLNEALRICDGFFKIDADGNGIAKLVGYLKS